MKSTEDSYDCDSMKMSEKDRRTIKEILKIRYLDASIRELEVQLKVAKKETTDSQSRACDIFKKQLSHVEPSGNILIKNTRRFLDMFDEPAAENIGNKDHAVEDVIVMQSLQLQNEDPVNSTSIGDEEKRLEVLINDSTEGFTVNPYRISESSGVTLQEIQDTPNAPSQDCQS